MTTKTKISKAVRSNGNRQIVGAIRKHLTEPMIFRGVTYTPGQLAKVFQKGIELADATDAARHAWLATSGAEQEHLQGLLDLQDALRKHVDSRYGEDSTTFTDFGFAPRKVAKVSAATKAESAKKAGETRKSKEQAGANPPPPPPPGPNPAHLDGAAKQAVPS
jgi:hypothetical protein